MLFGTDPQSKDQIKKAKLALSGIKKSCLQNKERMYLSNSKDIIKLILKFDQLDQYPQLFYSDILDNGKLLSATHKKQQQSQEKQHLNTAANRRLESVRQIIKSYSENNFYQQSV